MPARSSDDSLMELIHLLIGEMRSNAASTAEGFNKVNASLDRVNESIDRLTLNVSQNAQAIAELRKAIERQNAAIDGHLVVAREQASNIDKLIGLAAAQQAMVDRLLAKN